MSFQSGPEYNSEQIRDIIENLENLTQKTLEELGKMPLGPDQKEFEDL